MRYSRHFAALTLVVSLGGSCLAQPGPKPKGGADCAKTTGYDAIIVGAGLAGLTAAKELQAMDPPRKVLILERNDRIGGRAFAGDIGKLHIDYGGAWIHGETDELGYSNPLKQVVTKTPGFHLSPPTEFDVPFFFNNRWVKEGDDERELFDRALEDFEEALESAVHAEEAVDFVCRTQVKVANHQMSQPAFCAKITAKLEKLGSKRSTASLCNLAPQLPPEKFCGVARKRIGPKSDVGAAFVPKDEMYTSILPLLIGNSGPLESAAELEQTSAIDSAQFLAGEDYFVEQGMGGWVAEFGKKAPVCLNSPVKSIQYSTKGVSVQAGDRTYTGSTALVTVSVGVLQAKKINFDPPLPQWKLDAINGLAMGNMQKVIIPFKSDSDIFQAQKDNSWVMYEGELDPQKTHQVMAFVIKPFGANMAIGFTGGDRAKTLEGRCQALKEAHGPAVECDSWAVQAATTALGHMFGADKVAAAAERSQIQVTHWSLDETSLGAYSVALPGHWNAREILRRSIGAGPDGKGAKRLFFAGEAESDAKFNGSYPGAWTTGHQAADEINAQLARQKSAAKK